MDLPVLSLADQGIGESLEIASVLEQFLKSGDHLLSSCPSAETDGEGRKARLDLLRRIVAEDFLVDVALLLEIGAVDRRIEHLPFPTDAIGLKDMVDFIHREVASQTMVEPFQGEGEGAVFPDEGTVG